MPAALQLESMTRLGGLVLLMEHKDGKYIYIRKIEKSVFYKMIRPEQELYSGVEIITRKRGVYQLKGRSRRHEITTATVRQYLQ